MKKYLRVISFGTALIFMLMFYSCGSSKDINTESVKNSTAQNNVAYEADYDMKYEEMEEAVLEKNYLDEGGSAYEMQTVSSTSSQLPANRKIIRDANISIEADSVEEAYNKLLTNMSALGGYEANRNMSGEEKTAYLNATIKIPADNLDEFLSAAKSVGKVLNSYITSSDITDQYFDSQTRLTTLEKTLIKYYEFLDGATKISDQLEISRQISDITYQIESLKGRLRQWDSLVEYSTVEIYINCTPEPYVETREITWNSLSLDDVKYLATRGIVGISSAIVSTVQWFLIVVISLSPIIIPFGILIFIIVKIKRKKKKDREKEKKQQDTQDV